MAMEPGGEKVACGMAKASLFERKVSSKAKSLWKQCLFRDGSPGRRSFAVTADGRLAVGRSVLSIRPRKWFGTDQATHSFFTQQG